MSQIAAYCRVSSPKTNGQSRQDTKSQRERIKAYAKAQGYARVRWFEDHATGRNAKRDGLGELLDACRSGSVRTILVTDLSRLSRSVKDAVALIGELHERDVKLCCINQGLTFDRSAMSTFMLQVFAALAELESSIKSERIKAGLAASNKTPGRPRDEAKRARVRKMRSKGWTIQKIAAEMKLTKAGVYYLLAG